MRRILVVLLLLVATPSFGHGELPLCDENNPSASPNPCVVAAKGNLFRGRGDGRVYKHNGTAWVLEETLFECTVAQLTSGDCIGACNASSVGNRARVTNAFSETTCSTGGGSFKHVCECDGVSFTTPGAGQAADVSLWANEPAAGPVDMDGNSIADASSVATTCAGTGDCEAVFGDNNVDATAPADGVAIYSKADEPWSRAVGGAAKAFCLEDGTNCPAGSPTPTHADCFTIWAPSAKVQDTDDVKSVWRAPAAVTITDIWCETDATTVTANLQRDDGTPVDISTADIACDTDGQASAGLAAAEDNVADGQRIDLDIVTHTGTPARLSFCFEYTYD